MKPSTKRLVSLVGALVLVFAALVVYFNLTVPEYDVIDKTRGDVASRQLLSDAQQGAIKQVQKLISDYQGKNQIRDTVSLALPTVLDQGGILHQVQTLASVNKLSMQSFSISAPVSQSISVAASSSAIIRPIGNLNFQFRVVGTYEDFKNFLGNLETNIRIFDIRSASVDPLGKPNQDFYGFDLTVVTYYQNP